MEYSNRPENRLKDLRNEIKAITWLKPKKENMKHRDIALAEIENILAQVPWTKDQGELVCDICSRRFRKRKYSRMDLCSSECFAAQFWLDKIKYLDDFSVARINGNHYKIGAEDDTGGFRGFAGSKFLILFNDGRFVRTTNLWHQGRIPKAFKNILPENAVFLKGKDLKDALVYNKEDWLDSEQRKIKEQIHLQVMK